MHAYFCLFISWFVVQSVWKERQATLSGMYFKLCFLCLNIVQDTISDSWVLGDAVVHLFTDDPLCRNDYQHIYKEAVETEQLQFGPTNRKSSKKETGCSSEDMNFQKFKRESSMEESMVDFVCMSLCDKFVGTTGSTVTEVVEMLNKTLGQPFIETKIVGKYAVNTECTNKFKSDLDTLVTNAYAHFWDRSENRITQDQANVLEFLNDAHLSEMHTILEGILKQGGGAMPGSEVGAKFQEQCKVAKLNRQKYVSLPSTPGGQHWMKALLRGRMNHFSATNHRVSNHIVISDDNILMLQPKPSRLERSSGSDSQPSAKRQRTG